jgi:hypothetical protein
MLSRLARRRLAAFALVCTFLTAGCDDNGLPQIDDKVSDDEAPETGIRAPSDPDSGRHISVTLSVTPSDLSVSGTPTVAHGWAAGNPASEDAVRVRLYDSTGDVIYETGVPDPSVRGYVGRGRLSGAPPHTVETAPQAEFGVLLPLSAKATHMVVARDDKVVSVVDLRPSLRAACEEDKSQACKGWLRARGHD